MAKDKASKAQPVKKLPNWTLEDYKPPYKEGSGLQPNEVNKKEVDKKKTGGVTRPKYDIRKIFDTR